MFTVDHEHTRDNDEGASVLSQKSQQGEWGRVIFIYPGKEYIYIGWGASTPLRYLETLKRN